MKSKNHDLSARLTEATWLLNHVPPGMRYEENREWYERWQRWLGKVPYEVKP